MELDLPRDQRRHPSSHLAIAARARSDYPLVHGIAVPPGFLAVIIRWKSTP